jgi:iron complex outermembrane receptor protein
MPRLPVRQTLLLLALPLAVQAESPIDEVLVTASRDEPATSAATHLDREQLQPMLSHTNDSASLLRGVPGVSHYAGGGVSSLPAIHGLADDRIRTRINGMDLISACANHMNSPLSYIDPSQVGQITVFSGITPVSVGGDSIGGTILVESMGPVFAEAGAILRTGRAGVSYRSNNDALSGNLSATLANERFSIHYQGATVEAGNYHAGADFKPAGVAAAGRGWLDADEVGSSGYKASNQSVSLGLRQDNHLLQLQVGVQDIPYQAWPNQRMDMTANDSTQVNLNYTGEFNWGQLQASAYNEHTRHSMQFHDDKLYWYGSNNPAAVPFYPDGVPCPVVPGPMGMNGCAAGMPMDTEGDNTGVSVVAEIDMNARDQLRIGAEMQAYRLDDWWAPSGKGMAPSTFWNIRDGQRDRAGVFAEWDARWTPAWLTQLGIRYEQVSMDTGTVQGYNIAYGADAAAFNRADRSKTDDNIDLSALARFTPDEIRSIELGYSRKVRSPNLYERYAWSTGGMAMRMVNWAGDGNGYVGNLNLVPEIAHTLSATFDWQDPEQGRWGFRLTPYYTYVDDYIDVARCSAPNCLGPMSNPANLTATNGFVYLQFVNQSAELYGLDVSAFMSLADNTAMGDIRLGGLLNYSRGENDSSGDDLYNIMPLNATLTLNQKKGHWNSALELLLVDDKDRVSATRNEVETGGYALVNLRGSYRFQQARLDFGVENLFDRFYNEPLGGAYLGQGKTMSGSGVAWGTPVPGAGRSIYAGISVDF